MPKWVCEPIILPENYTWQDLEDAKLTRLNHGWRKVTTREEVMSRTDLSNKCGSCKYFQQFEGKTYGTCGAGCLTAFRSKRCCTRYERSEE